ncbi:hypothetical protein [Cohnella rhizosphaerae]|uniref:Polymer-forming cytoskeletal protein n=1 Tax=Cohnella rhizosphaerae TaxID=1457232 RepID=A0A9X4KV23_9BACL|nr:hypothetical protein [Cohnella rhizosphaerae]MDG0808552.1 hypothetical protein [Cohnella rhizosphaerae]
MTNEMIGDLKMDGIGTAAGGVYKMVALNGVCKVAGEVEAQRFDADGRVRVDGRLTVALLDLDGTLDIAGGASIGEAAIDGVITVKGTYAGRRLRLNGMLTVGEDCEMDVIEGGRRLQDRRAAECGHDRSEAAGQRRRQGDRRRSDPHRQGTDRRLAIAVAAHHAELRAGARRRYDRRRCDRAGSCDGQSRARGSGDDRRRLRHRSRRVSDRASQASVGPHRRGGENQCITKAGPRLNWSERALRTEASSAK